MRKKLDNIWIGMATGVLGEIFGLLILFLWYSGATGRSSWANYWYQLTNSALVSSKLMMFALIFNALLFYLFMRLKMDKMANGIVGASILITIFIVIIYFF